MHEYPFVLRQRLTDAGVVALADVLTSERTDVIAQVATRFNDRLSGECNALRREMNALAVDLRAEMQTLRLELRADFQVAVANTRVDLLKWSFLFWIGQVAAVLGFLAIST
jgi:hypothetical protein